MLQKNFGNHIKKIRNMQGITQIRMSELTGINREQISKIENGQINPTLDTVYKIGVAFGMQLRELFDFDIEMKLEQYEKEKKNYETKPFVKWAGGKTQIIDRIMNYMPKRYNTYYEPFLGGGAVLFNLKPKKAVIADINEELIKSFKCFQDNDSYIRMIDQLIEYEEKHSEEFYYELRAIDRRQDFNNLDDYFIAARMIYLNKACFNGLYRVNSNGYFNVPSGKKKNVRAYDKENFDSIYDYFNSSDITITSDDYEKVVESAKPGDFVYFDPPYDVLDEKKTFTSYSKSAFGKEEQERLSKVYKKLSDKGVYVMLSNHNTQFINELYKEFNINVIKAKRMINSKGSGRGDVEEVIITNY
jgi:DNA adenine methylase